MAELSELERAEQARDAGADMAQRLQEQLNEANAEIQRLMAS